MELFKEEMELFLLLPGLWSKTSFTKYYSMFQGAHHRFSKQETESLEQEMDYFAYLQASDQKTSFYKIYLIYSKRLKIDFQNRK